MLHVANSRCCGALILKGSDGSEVVQHAHQPSNPEKDFLSAHTHKHTHTRARAHTYYVTCTHDERYRCLAKQQRGQKTRIKHTKETRRHRSKTKQKKKNKASDVFLFFFNKIKKKIN